MTCFYKAYKDNRIKTANYKKHLTCSVLPLIGLYRESTGLFRDLFNGESDTDAILCR